MLYRKLRIIEILKSGIFLLLLLLPLKASSFDGVRKGFVMGTGLEISPHISWSYKYTDNGVEKSFSETETGWGKTFLSDMPGIIKTLLSCR